MKNIICYEASINKKKWVRIAVRTEHLCLSKSYDNNKFKYKRLKDFWVKNKVTLEELLYEKI